MPDRAGLIELTQKLQEQSDVPAWVVASSSTVLAVAANEEECYGPRGKWFYRIFNTLGVTFAAQIVLQLIGSIVVTIWWLKCRKVNRRTQLPEALFIGFGAGPETQMLETFRIEVGCEVAHIDQTKPASLANVALPSLMQLWKQCAIEARKVINGLRFSRNSHIHDNARQWLVSSAIRFSDYVYVKTWAEALPEPINRLVFISADIPAFAALDAKNSDKRKIEFRQHGLLKISIVFPLFKDINSINRQEALHIMRRLPNAEVTVASEAYNDQVVERTATILFVSPYESGPFSKHDYKHIIQAIHMWAMERDMRLVVRPHPSEGPAFWQSQFPEIPIDNTVGGFYGAMSQFKPLWVVGWYSTALLDALKAGVLPILIMNGSEVALEDMAFPLAEIALNWPKDMDILKRLSGDSVLYRKELETRQQAVFGEIH